MVGRKSIKISACQEKNTKWYKGTQRQWTRLKTYEWGVCASQDVLFSTEMFYFFLTGEGHFLVRCVL